MKKIFLALGSTLLLASCAYDRPPVPYVKPEVIEFYNFDKPQDPAQAKAEVPSSDADYGSYPSNFKSIIKSYFDDHLIDPDSVKYSKWTDPKKAYLMFGSSSTPKYGYGVEVLVNAKNSFGGYTGNKHYWVLIKDGLITEIYEKYIIEGIAFKMGYVD